jgi:hypothetical protein
MNLAGRIKVDGLKYFYLKDHLGSIRAVVDENGGIMDARDGVYPDMLLIGNPWGHIIREYDNSDNDPTRNKFTGKERDWESGGVYPVKL